MGIPLVAGREFTDGDAHAPKVAIVNEKFPSYFFGNQNAVGSNQRTEYNVLMSKLFLSPLLCLCVFAQTPAIDQSLSMKSVQDARISPDGRYVAYTVQQANWEENEFV